MVSSSSSSDTNAGFTFKGRQREQYSVYRARLEAKLRAKKLWSVCDSNAKTAEDRASPTTVTDEKKVRKQDKATQVVLSSLGDVPFRVVESAISKPATMIHLLDERYASTRAVSRISLMTQLYRMRYSGGSMSKHCDTMASIFSQLEKIGKNVAVPDSHKGVILLDSIGVESPFESTAAALRTRPAEGLTIEHVSITLIDEEKSRRNNGESSHTRHRKGKKKDNRGKNQEQEKAETKIASPARNSGKCIVCQAPGHKADDCYMNPENPNNRLPQSLRDLYQADKSDSKTGKSKKSKVVIAGAALTSFPIIETADPGNAVNASDITSDVNDMSENTNVIAKLTTEKSFFCDEMSDISANARATATIGHAIAATPNSNAKESDSLVDSGASGHMSNEVNCFSGMTECSNQNIGTADGSTASAKGIGTTTIDFDNAKLVLSNTFYTPHLQYNLISVGALTDNGITVIFEDDQCIIKKGNNLIGIVYKDPVTRLYPIDPSMVQRFIPTVASAVLWHMRSGHAGMQKFMNLHRYVDDVPQLKKTNQPLCEACEKGKAHKQPFKGHMETASRPGEVIFSDVGGPYTVGWNGHRYFITFIDGKSRYLWIITSPNRRIRLYFPLFQKEFRKLGDIELLRVHSDKAKDYLPLQKTNPSIQFTTTTGYAPEHNPFAERINRTIKDPARTMLIAADLPSTFWPYAVEQAARIYNQLPHSAINCTPFEKLYGRRPSAKNWKPFGSKAYVFIPKEKRKSMEPKAVSGILLVCLPHGIFRVLTESGEVIESRHVRIDEMVFPGREFLQEHGILDVEDEDNQDALESEYEPDNAHESSNNGYSTNESAVLDTLEFHDEVSTDSSSSDEDVHVSEENVNLDSAPLPDEPLSGEESDDDDNMPALHESEYEDESESDEDRADPQDLVTHTPAKPSSFGEHSSDDDDDSDYEEDNDVRNNNVSDRPKRNRKKPDRFVAGVTVTTSDDPTLSEAMNASPEEREVWIRAIQEEHDTLMENGSLETPVMVPAGVSTLPSFIVLHIKRNSDGTVERFKARIVAGGHMQRPDDYSNTHAPVVDFAIIMLMLNLILLLNYRRRHVDIKAAFLNGTLDEDIYIRLPRGMPKHLAGIVRKLLKAMYGLKQAHFQWHKKLTGDLKRHGFTELFNTNCVFIKRSKESFILILVYVDDILIAAQNDDEIDEIVHMFSELYKIRDLGDVNWFLGVEIKWSEENHGQRHATLCQAQAITRFLDEQKIVQGREVWSPMITNFYSVLRQEKCKEVVDQEGYQKIIGYLLYFALRTRPDILAPVTILARFTARPTSCCWNAARRLLRYLRTTEKATLRLSPVQIDDPTLVGYVDSDFAGDHTDRKSMSGGVLMFCGSFVTCFARKQSVTATST